jgi:hypothetical protein
MSVAKKNLCIVAGFLQSTEYASDIILTPLCTKLQIDSLKEVIAQAVADAKEKNIKFTEAIR